MEPKILYEDADVVVVNKPAGLIMHSDGRTEEPSVAEWMLEKYPESKNVGEPWVSPQGETIARPGIVHRLDRGTSGVVVLAKTPAAYSFLKEQFQSRTAKKTYRALVYGAMSEARGIIEKEIVRLRSSPPRWGVARAGEDKKQRVAITAWKRLAEGADPESGEKVSYLELSPKTGRTHQIRVHLKSIHHPVVCDPLYAEGRPALFGLARPALHAYALEITLPSGERRVFEAPLPPDFALALERFASE